MSPELSLQSIYFTVKTGGGAPLGEYQQDVSLWRLDILREGSRKVSCFCNGLVEWG